MSMPGRYLDICKIEIKDLTDDIGLLVEEYKRRKEKNEITNYVFLENLAVLHNQMQGVDSLVETLNTLAPENYDDLDQMVRDVKKRIRDKIKKSDFNEALYLLVSRKLEKVAAYIKHFND